MIKMKDSGIEWIGKIPDAWKVVPFKTLLKKKKEIIEKWNEENVLSLSMNGVVIRDLVNPSGKMPATFDGYQKIDNGNFILCLFDIDVTPSCVGIAYDDGVTSPAYSQYITKWGVTQYYYYLLLMMDYDKVLLSYSKTLRSTLTDEYFGAVKVAITSDTEEQQKIADFLDEKAVIIDEIIADTKQSIEVLKTYKQSLITEMVTRGLDQDDILVLNGVKRIEDSHKKLDLTKIKYLAKIDPSFDIEIDEENLATFLPMDRLKNGYLINDLSQKVKDLKGKYSFFANGDIIIAKVRPSFENGNLAIATNLTNGIGFATSEIFTIRNLEFNKYNTRYLAYYLRNNNFISISSSTMTRVAGLKRVSSKFIQNYLIPKINFEQGEIIADFLDKKTSEIDTLIVDKESLVLKYESYKKSMIYEYVTGKKRLNDMHLIYLIANFESIKTSEELKEKFESIVDSRMNELHFANTEGTLTWIVRGSIDYFSSLRYDFLGKNNDSGIPSMEADHFANNFYRLSNTLDYLGRLWKWKSQRTKSGAC